jgi:hypothetical protein
MEKNEVEEFSQKFAYSLICAPPAKKSKVEDIEERFENIFSRLPIEILLYIVQYINDPKGIVYLFSTSEYLHRIFKEQDIESMKENANKIRFILFHKVLDEVFPLHDSDHTKKEKEKIMEDMKEEDLKEIWKTFYKKEYEILPFLIKRDIKEDMISDILKFEYKIGNIDLLFRFMGFISSEFLTTLVVLKSKRIAYGDYIKGKFIRIFQIYNIKDNFIIMASIKNLNYYKNYIFDYMDKLNLYFKTENKYDKQNMDHFFIYKSIHINDKYYDPILVSILSRNVEVFDWVIQFDVIFINNLEAVDYCVNTILSLFEIDVNVYHHFFKEMIALIKYTNHTIWKNSVVFQLIYKYTEYKKEIYFEMLIEWFELNIYLTKEGRHEQYKIKTTTRTGYLEDLYKSFVHLSYTYFLEEPKNEYVIKVYQKLKEHYIEYKDLFVVYRTMK